MLLTLTRVLTLRTKNTCKNDYNNNSKNKSNNGNSTVLSRAMRGHATAFEIRTTMRFIFFFFGGGGGGLGVSEFRVFLCLCRAGPAAVGPSRPGDTLVSVLTVT